jgi:hypothetical protein
MKSSRKSQSDERKTNEALAAQNNYLQLIIGAGTAIAVALVAVGYILYHEITVLDRKVSALQRTTQAGINRVSTLASGNTTGIVALLRAQGNLDEHITRIESTFAPKPPGPQDPIANLTPTETASLRALFDLARSINASPQFKVGDKVPAAELKPVPANVYRTIPRLKGTSFLIDRNGSLVVTAGPDNAVVLIVRPA